MQDFATIQSSYGKLVPLINDDDMLSLLSTYQKWRFSIATVNHQGLFSWSPPICSASIKKNVSDFVGEPPNHVTSQSEIPINCWEKTSVKCWMFQHVYVGLCWFYIYRSFSWLLTSSGQVQTSMLLLETLLLLNTHSLLHVQPTHFSRFKNATLLNEILKWFLLYTCLFACGRKPHF